MGHSPDQHIEHAEHAAHAAHDPFDKTITLSIAITAAALAFVTMLSHRSHNETLRHQADANSKQTEAGRVETEVGLIHAESNRLQTLASLYKTQAADQWAFYQAKNIRKHEYQSFVRLIAIIPRDKATDEARQEANDFWTKQANKYESELAEMKIKAEKIDAKAEEYQRQASQVLERTTEVVKKKDVFLNESEDLIHKSHEAHLRSDRYDLGELGVELALVLSSISLLMRQKRFWLVGIACGVVGFLVALSGYFNLWMPSPHGSHSDDHGHPPAAQKAHHH